MPQAPPIRVFVYPDDFESLKHVVCQEFGIEKEEIMKKTRSRRVSTPRHAAMFFAQYTTSFTQIQIANHFGFKGHDSVIYAKDVISNLCWTNKKFRDKINRIADKINVNLKKDFDWNR